MMFGFMFSSIVGGQILARTGKYKILAIVGFAVAAIGLFLLSRMDVNADNALVVRNMIIMGLGIGVSMSLFTIVVQNAFPIQAVGQVTSSLTFFRSMGSTIGIAVLGSVMTNRFASALDTNLPASLKQAIPPHQLDAFKNPQLLLSTSAMDTIEKGFSQFGPQGPTLFHELMMAIRVSLASAITSLFFVGAVAMVLALITVLFLREIPLRKANSATTVTAPSPSPRLRDAAAGLTLAAVARVAQRPEPSPHLMAALAELADGQVPHQGSIEQRGRAVARTVIQPLAIALLQTAAGAPKETGDGNQAVSRNGHASMPMNRSALITTQE